MSGNSDMVLMRDMWLSWNVMVLGERVLGMEVRMLGLAQILCRLCEGGVVLLLLNSVVAWRRRYLK